MLFSINSAKNKESKFVLSNFLSKTILFSILHTSLICCILIQYFKDNGMLPLQISIIIISKRVLRLICDIFFGLIFDRFGPKIVFLLGRSLKLFSYFILLFFPTFYGFILAMLLDGASYSSIYGKINSYIYNNLSARQQLKSFPQAISLYYLCVNLTISMMTFFAGILLKTQGYNIIIYISIALNIFSIFFLIKFIPNDTIIKTFQVKTIKNIFLTLKTIAITKPQFLHLIILYGIVSFIAWQFHSISSLIMLDLGVSSVKLAMYGSILKLTMCIGAIISIVFFKKNISLKTCINYVLILILFGLLTALIYNEYLFYAFCLLIALSYTTMEVCIEKNFEFVSDKTIRGTTISIAMTFCSFMAIFANILVGIIAQYINYRFSLTILLTIIAIIIIYNNVKLYKYGI